MARKIFNILFLNTFTLVNVSNLISCNYQTVNKYYLTEDQLKEMILNKKETLLFSKPEDLQDISILKQTLINQIDNASFKVDVILKDDQNNEIGKSKQLVIDQTDINKVIIPKVIYHLSRKKDVYLTEKRQETHDITIENKIVRYAVKVDQRMVEDISKQIYTTMVNKKDNLLTVHSAEFEIIEMLNQSISIVHNGEIYQQIFEKYLAITITNLVDISQIANIHVKGLGEMNNQFIISQLDHSLFVFDQNIIDNERLIQIKLNLNIMVNDDGINKTIKISEFNNSKI